MVETERFVAVTRMKHLSTIWMYVKIDISHTNDMGSGCTTPNRVLVVCFWQAFCNDLINMVLSWMHSLDRVISWPTIISIEVYDLLVIRLHVMIDYSHNHDLGSGCTTPVSVLVVCFLFVNLNDLINHYCWWYNLILFRVT